MPDEWHRENERERKRVEAFRAWHRVAWTVVGVLGAVAIYLKLKQVIGW